ncbi:hypothetical protein ABZ541_04850 [Micromonospora sediminicola]|uniref:recombinase family protein n=1 Tax=Micromonospora sediminicola TaxID=946078 RepID=UPI0033C51B87
MVLTRGRTLDNADNLSPEALEELLEQYGGTWLGRQELDAELLSDVDGALWKSAWIEPAGPTRTTCRRWHVRWDAETASWSRCAPDVLGSGPDLTRLYEHARWDADARRSVRRRAVLFSRAVRGDRATLEGLTKAALRWCAEQGYEGVGKHIGTRGWREAVADVDEGTADVVVVPSVERLGFGKQVFERVDADGKIVAASMSARRCEECSRWPGEAGELGCPPTNINELLEGMGVPPFVPTVEHSLTQRVDCSTDVWIGPNQRGAAERAPNATLVLCMACALAEQHKREAGSSGTSSVAAADRGSWGSPLSGPAG